VLRQVRGHHRLRARLTVVLSDGRAVRLGGARLKDVAGLSLTKLFVGSEGTLGVITEVLLRLIPEQRQPTALVATFPTMDSATDAVLAITRSMRLSLLEFMDRVTINAVQDATRMGLDRDVSAMLTAQSDEPAGHAAVEIGLIEDICNQNGASDRYSTDDPEAGEAFIVARRMAIPAVEKLGAMLLDDIRAARFARGPVEGGTRRLFVLQADAPLVAEFAASGDPFFEGEFASSGSTATGVVGDVDVAELRSVLSDDRSDIVAVDGEVVEVG